MSNDNGLKVLITGGAGFIGRTLQEQLEKQGNTVVLLDKRHAFSPDSNSMLYIQADMCDREKILSVFKAHQFDGVIHLAAVSRVIEAQNNPEECERTNVGGIHNLLACLEETQQKAWLIFGSSREVYGEATVLPVKENAPQVAVNIYGETKIKGEELFRDFAKKHQLNCAITRFSNVYGNRYDIFDRVIPRFIRAIVQQETLTIEGGDQVIDFTHIDDTVEGLLKMIRYLHQTDQVQDDFHLCPGVGWTLFQLIEYIEKATAMRANIKTNLKRNYDVVKFIGDASKTNQILQLSSFIPLEEGVAQSIAEYCHDLDMDHSQ